MSNCEREQIHLAGSIQPYGVLLVLRESDHVIIQASRNAATMLGLSSPVLGRPVTDLPGNLAAQIGPHLDAPTLHTMPLGVQCVIGVDHGLFDVALHRPPQGGIVIELVPAVRAVNHVLQATAAIERILAAFSLRMLCDDSAELFRDLTGYDRVMVYRFDEEGHGEVLSEQRLPALEPFLGNRYPASDIPQVARRLYERNRVRVLVDINYDPVPVLPEISPLTGQPLDMSLCLLRSVSPIHVQYLKNMGVAATLVISLMVGGRLWGLVACHHYAPRTVSYDIRVVCELLAEAVATRISALESSDRGRAELAVRRLEQRLADAIQREGDWRGALFDSAQSLLQPMRATGAALLFDDQVIVTGDVPGTQELRRIGVWLDGRPKKAVHATASLGLDEPAFKPLRAIASGLTAASLSSTPGEYLLWFRPERVRTVTWGGDPTKPVVVGGTPKDLSPRRSFAQWHQLVEWTSEPWTETDLSTARLIGDSVRDVILQFRSVSVLVAQLQLEKARQHVSAAEAPVVIARGDGRILMISDAMNALLGTAQPLPRMLTELSNLFIDAGDCRRRLADLCDRGMAWRGRVELRCDARPLLVRADPVLSAPGQVSGFVVLLTDVRQQVAAEVARTAFQTLVLQRTRTDGATEREIDPATQAVLATVVENAQLAALEITEGVDLAIMPEMLDSVGASVSRARRAVSYLTRHANSLVR